MYVVKTQKSLWNCVIQLDHLYRTTSAGVPMGSTHVHTCFASRTTRRLNFLHNTHEIYHLPHDGSTVLSVVLKDLMLINPVNKENATESI